MRGLRDTACEGHGGKRETVREPHGILRFLEQRHAERSTGGCNAGQSTGARARVTTLFHEARCRTADAFQAYLQSASSRLRYALELHIVRTQARGRELHLPGICLVCDRIVEFRTKLADVIEGEQISLPNWREELLCPDCNLSNRQRLVATLVVNRVQSAAKLRQVYVTEQVTALFSVLTAKMQPVSVVGSEFLGAAVPGGTTVDNVRNEDVQKLSFADESMSLVVSCDVLEHIPRPDRAMSEFCRILSPGGELILTVPFHTDRRESRVRATLRGDEIHHALPAEYHGNPLSPKGSLVFSDFGWDLLDRLRDAGFSSVAMVCYWSPEHGHLGINNSIIHCVR
jgi:SAM-dependent methyltransferase